MKATEAPRSLKDSHLLQHFSSFSSIFFLELCLLSPWAHLQKEKIKRPVCVSSSLQVQE